MRAAICSLAFFCVIATGATAKTALEEGAIIAAKRGYSGEKGKCYASVFAEFASPNSAGVWTGPRGKAANAYKSSLLSKCGIDR